VNDSHSPNPRWGWLPVVIAIAFSLGIALLIYGPHLFNLTVPFEGDARAHIFKIDIMHSYLSHSSWPQWVSYWYNGFPMDPFYPPGFYFLGSILTFIVGQSVIAYKLLLFLALILNGLTIYFFSRRFLKFNLIASISCLLAYEGSAALLVNYLYGEGPNLLGWSVIVLFITVYLNRIPENKFHRRRGILVPGLLLGVSILIHPFPVIFASLAVIVFHLIWKLHHRSIPVWPQIIYFILVFITGGMIGTFYWLPALLTFRYASPIYVHTNDIWIGGVPYVLSVIMLSLIVAVIVRRKLKGDFKFDFLLVCSILAAALGFGATRFIPFGIGTLLHEFRFATIISPFFCILLIGYLIKYQMLTIKKESIFLAFLISCGLTAAVYFVGKSDFIALILNVSSSLGNNDFSASDYILNDLVSFGIIMPLFFVILLISFSLDFHPSETLRRNIFPALSISACLILIVGILPLFSTWDKGNMKRLFSYVDNYRQPAYGQLMQSVKNNRLIVPPGSGYLTEGDSPVTFGWRWGVETINGPYNQGDPKFFKYTVYLEWENRWLEYETTRENLMQEGAAGYLFVRNSRPAPEDLAGMTSTARNSYGALFQLDQNVARAAAVTPVLLDVQYPEKVTQFFNVLLPHGYRLVFVDVHQVESFMIDKFSYVMVDDLSRLPEYKGKKVLVLVDKQDSPALVQDQGYIQINVPYTSFSDLLFFHGSNGDARGWSNFQRSVSQDMMSNTLAVMQTIGAQISPVFQDMSYHAVNYESSQNRVDVITKPGFTLIKDSYFPYWSIKHGEIIPTTQGFILVNSDSTQITLNYKQPVAYTIAAGVTIITLLGAILILLIVVLLKTGHPDHSRRY
jgi:hypothetical protein